MSEHPTLVSIRVLDLAERITTLIEADVWTRTTIPAQQEVQRRMGAGRELIASAFTLLVDRGVLRLYLDREVSPRPRYLPAKASALHESTSNVAAVGAMIEERLTSGRWTAENFPDIVSMRRELRCRSPIASAALRDLETRGLVRRAKVGRTWRWVPAGHAHFEEVPLHERIAKDIHLGVWTGPLPVVIHLSRHYRVGHEKTADALRKLEKSGLIRRVWLPDFTRRVWYVMNDDAPAWLPPGNDTKAVAVAADLVHRMPEWVTVGPAGTLIDRRQLPSLANLVKHYHCHCSVVATAIRALVIRGVLEPDGTPALPRYRPLRVPVSCFGDNVVPQRASQPDTGERDGDIAATATHAIRMAG